uniref:Uncharacterized protein n=1 Tax=Megaselia scalaris TaxID=36166 RepID=T1GMK4_MEGSC
MELGSLRIANSLLYFGMISLNDTFLQVVRDIFENQAHHILVVKFAQDRTTATIEIRFILILVIPTQPPSL